MFIIHGEIYDFVITHTKINITSSKVPSLKEVHITALPEEDFSVFDLGPAIASNIIMQAGETRVGNAGYLRTCLIIKQVPGKEFQIKIKKARENNTDPLDSGIDLYYIHDYVMKYE